LKKPAGALVQNTEDNCQRTQGTQKIFFVGSVVVCGWKAGLIGGGFWFSRSPAGGWGRCGCDGGPDAAQALVMFDAEAEQGRADDKRDQADFARCED
jgi:hypothetical protein